MRIDKFCAEKYGSRSKAERAIENGFVLVNGKTVSPSYVVRESDKIEYLQQTETFVSNGGYKLSKAITEFCFCAEGKVFVDIGASTGGFTDCLLQNGARKVYCVDVGESQLDHSLTGERVVVIDNFNARNLNKELFREQPDGAVIDVSFISLTYVLGGAGDILSEGGDIIALVKPQFECESKKVGKNGIVKDKSVRLRVLNKIYDFALGIGLTPLKITNAPIREGKNIEYLIWFKKGKFGSFDRSMLTNIAKL